VLWLSVLALIASLIVGLWTGPTPVTLSQLAWSLAHPNQSLISVIIWQIRLPRVLAAALVGGSLALAGLVFQALLKNPLADPYLIGTSSGASLGATLMLLVFPIVAAIPAGAFVGAVAAVFAATAAARRRGGSSVVTVVLVGYALSVILGATTALLLTLHANDLQTIFFWELGGLGGVLWPQVTELAVALVVGVGGVLYLHRELDAVAIGEEEAHALGIDVRRLRWQLIILAGLVTAVAVSASGLIGFVGLVAPHVARRLVGSLHRYALPVSVLGGASFLILADTIARSLPGIGEIPVGIVTALLGGPFFIVLLLRTTRLEGGR
jgi:iron complex transport system permease protein